MLKDGVKAIADPLLRLISCQPTEKTYSKKSITDSNLNWSQPVDSNLVTIQAQLMAVS